MYKISKTSIEIVIIVLFHKANFKSTLIHDCSFTALLTTLSSDNPTLITQILLPSSNYSLYDFHSFLNSFP